MEHLENGLKPDAPEGVTFWPDEGKLISPTWWKGWNYK